MKAINNTKTLTKIVKDLAELKVIEAKISKKTMLYSHANEAIAEIQALVKEAIPEKRGIHSVSKGIRGKNATVSGEYVINSVTAEQKIYNQAISVITTALIERGLMEGEEK